jgi:hypothetical protein
MSIANPSGAAGNQRKRSLIRHQLAFGAWSALSPYLTIKKRSTSLVNYIGATAEYQSIIYMASICIRIQNENALVFQALCYKAESWRSGIALSEKCSNNRNMVCIDYIWNK